MSEKYSLKEIQDEMLILLKMFHAFCVEHYISYSVHGGTMIGIVREQGFIPWDDDVDVSFTRREYNKFKKALETANFEENLYFSEYDNAFPQLWMKREGKPAVWIDFFIYDFITEDKIGQKIKFLKIAILLGLLKNKETMLLTKKRGTYKGAKYAIIYLGYLLGKTMSQEKKYKLADKVRKSGSGSRKLIHRANDRFIPSKSIYPKEVMEKFIMLPFEDTELMVAEDYDTILTPDYGPDYMTPKRLEGDEASLHNEAREILPGGKN